MSEHTLRDSLRTRTRPHHDRVEAALRVPDSIRTRQDYARLLRGLYGFHAPLEIMLARHHAALAKIGVDVAERRKAHHAGADLQALCDEVMDHVPLCSPLPLSTWRHALGAMYVAEGSTLGGEVIARQLRKRLNLQEEHHLRFLTAYGAGNGRMWRSFVASLNDAPLNEEESHEVVHGACVAFQVLEKWMVPAAGIEPATP